MMILQYLLVFVLAYLMGSISGSIIVSRNFFKEDIRLKGSGNAGTTNTFRAYGLKYSIISLLIDVVKGILAPLLIKLLADNFLTIDYATYVAGVAVVMGHIWPIYYGFKGGKGMATSVGVNIYHNVIIVLIQLLEFALINLAFKIMALTSIIMTLTSVVYVAIFMNNIPMLIMTSINAVMVIYAHRSNIQRMINGNENKIERLGSKK